jgi:hypothetical protein
MLDSLKFVIKAISVAIVPVKLLLPRYNQAVEQMNNDEQQA